MFNDDSALNANLNRQIQELTEKKYSVVDDFISPELCKALRQDLIILYEKGLFKQAAIGRGSQSQVATAIRGDFIHWLDEKTLSPAEHKLLQQIYQLQRILNQSFYLGLKSLESHYAMYPPGEGYQKHLDQHVGTQARKMTFILYLNQNWQAADGGELLLYNPLTSSKILQEITPLEGRFVLFCSDIFPHAVAPCLKTRMSITGWLRDDGTRP